MRFNAALVALAAFTSLSVLASTPVVMGGKAGTYPVPAIYQGAVQNVAYSAVNSTTASGSAASATTTASGLTSSACLTSVGSTNGILVGAVITDSSNATYITNGTTVVALPGTCSSGQMQMSVNAAHAISGDTLVFTNPVPASKCLTSVGATTGILVGAIITDSTTGANITAATTVVAIPGTCSAGQIQMSAPAAAYFSGDTLSFLNPAGASAAFHSGTQIILVSCSTDCYYLVGSAPVASSTTGSLLIANKLQYVGVAGGQKISAIQSSATGTLNITEGGPQTHSP